MEGNLTRAEHEEFARRMVAENKRLEDENNRQNKRIEQLEDTVNRIVVQQLTTLTTTIERLDLSVQNTLKEQSEISERVKNGKYCVVNNTYEPQDTVIYRGDESSFKLHLEANEIRWYTI